MALSGSRLQTSLASDILSQLNSQFPTNGSLLSAEQTAINNSKQALANAIAAACGPDVVSEITGNAAVAGTVTSGAGAGGAVSGTVS